VSFPLHVGAFGRVCVDMGAVAILPVVPLPTSTLLGVRACKRGRYGHSYGTAATGGIYSSACNGRTDTCAFCVGHRPFAPVAAGVVWTSRTTSAPWAARRSHTSVIDAAGAIYVIGGSSGTGNYLQDVWVSTDRARVGGTRRVLKGTHRVLKGYCPGTSGLLEGYSDGASGRLHARKRAMLKGCASALEGVLCGVLLAEGVLGAILYCGALDGLFSALQAVLGGTQGVLTGDSGYSRGTVGPLGGILGAR
jgi:hypothetical protein